MVGGIIIVDGLLGQCGGLFISLNGHLTKRPVTFVKMDGKSAEKAAQFCLHGTV